jgi:hypothetical protein
MKAAQQYLQQNFSRGDAVKICLTEPEPNEIERDQSLIYLGREQVR